MPPRWGSVQAAAYLSASRGHHRRPEEFVLFQIRRIDKDVVEVQQEHLPALLGGPLVEGPRAAVASGLEALVRLRRHPDLQRADESEVFVHVL